MERRKEKTKEKYSSHLLKFYPYPVVSYNLNLKCYVKFGNMLSPIQVPEQTEVMKSVVRSSLA